MSNSFIPGIGGAPDYAGLAAQNEKNRQGIINLGLQDINAIFGGGTAPFFSTPSGAFDPKQNYFSFAKGGSKAGTFVPYWVGNKQNLSPMFRKGNPRLSTAANYATLLSAPGISGAFDNLITGQQRNPNALDFATSGFSSMFDNLFGSSPSPQDLAKSAYKQGKLFTEQDQTFKGFQPDFYQQRAKDYTANALPQLASQYQSTKNSLGFGLANRGLYGGSASTKQMSELDRETGLAKQTIADTAQNQANSLQQQVEQARQNAITNLYQTADPSSASASAIGTAAQFRLPSTFAPIANMFSSLLNQYQTAQALNPQGVASPYAVAPQYSVTGAALPTN